MKLWKYFPDLSVLNFSRTFQKVLHLLDGLILNLKLKPQQNLDLFSFLPAQLIIRFLSRDWWVRDLKSTIGRLKYRGFPLEGRKDTAAKMMVYLSTYTNPLYSTSDLSQIHYTTHPTY